MYIDEVSEGSAIAITTYIGSNRLDFETTAASVDKKAAAKWGIKDRFLAVDLIQKDGKAVGFRPGIVYRVVCIHENTPYLWTELSILLLSLPDSEEKVHVITSKQDAKKYNRRSSYRQWVGIEGVVQINSNKKAVDAVIKDISSNGISIILRKEDVTPEPGEYVHIVFADESCGARFSLVANIVWRKDLGADRYVAGCCLKASSPAIERYIVQKQRSTLKTGGPVLTADKSEEDQEG